jgi:putative transposase
MRTDLVQPALAMAVAMRGQLADEVIMHADRGSRYTSGQLARFAREHNLVRSVGHTGDNTGTTRKPNRSGPQ